MPDVSQISGFEWSKLAKEAFEKADGDVGEMVSVLAGRMSQTMPGGRVASAFAAGVAELASYAVSEVGKNSDAIDAEVDAVEVSKRCVRPMLEAKLQDRLNRMDAETRGRTTCVNNCGNNAASHGRPSRVWGSSLGAIELQRRYRHCESCGVGSHPSEVALGLPEGEFTARLEEMVTMIAATVPHAMARKLAQKLCGIDVSVKAIEDMVAGRASKVRALIDTEAKLCKAYEKPGGLPVIDQQRPEDCCADVPEVAYMEIDGVLPITREEKTGDDLTAAERKAQAQAKAEGARGGKGRKYNIVGREVKNAVLYTAKDCVEQSPSRGCLLDKTYVSYLGTWTVFALHLWAGMLRQRFDEAKLLVILSDGADWIRSLAEWIPVPVLLILDLYHVHKRIWEVANVMYGDKTSAAAAWARTQCARVEAGQARDVLSALRFLTPKQAKAKKLVDALHIYITNNLDRMKYPEYKARGLRITSGVVESANFHVTGARLKLQGMRWSEAGAAGMAVLRADLFNDRWEQRTRELLAS